MTVAVLFVLLAAFLWGITNHIDKYMVSDIDESGVSIKTLLVFSTLIAGCVISPIWLIISGFNVSICLLSFICVLLSSLIYVAATYFYYRALNNNDASIIGVMFQLIPVFSYLLTPTTTSIENDKVKKLVRTIENNNNNK